MRTFFVFLTLVLSVAGRASRPICEEEKISCVDPPKGAGHCVEVSNGREGVEGCCGDWECTLPDGTKSHHQGHQFKDEHSFSHINPDGSRTSGYSRFEESSVGSHSSGPSAHLALPKLQHLGLPELSDFSLPGMPKLKDGLKGFGHSGGLDLGGLKPLTLGGDDDFFKEANARHEAFVKNAKERHEQMLKNF